MKQVQAKLIPVLITIMLLLSFLPMKTLAETDETKPVFPPQVEFPAKGSKDIVKEDTEKREENVKHFLLKDHTYEADVYPFPVHYKENGQWKDIDNTLVESTDSETNGPVLENKANNLKIKFAKKTNQNDLVRIKSGNYILGWNLDNIQDAQVVQDKVNIPGYDRFTNDEKKRTLEKIGSSVTYPEVMQNTDLQYILTSGSVKENLILKDVPTITQYSFLYNAQNLTAEIKDNIIYFYSESDPTQVIFKVEAPYMYDQNNEISTAISLELQKGGNQYQVILKPDMEWLQSTDRKYPVIIDPTVVTSLSPVDIFDNHVSQNYPTTNYYNSTILKVGNGASSGINQTFIKFKLPTISSANVITKANLYLSLFNPNTSGSQINVHKVTQDWNANTITWNTKPAFDNKVQDYQIVNSNTKTDYIWDITGIAKQWYTDQQNFGLMLKANNETGNYTEFFSSDVSEAYAGYRPVAAFYYVNNSGLESYWTYHSQDIGRAGTGYINDYSGNLVLSHNDLSMSGMRMPVSITHVYNSNDRLVNLKYGLGWRLNLSERIDADFTLDLYYFTDEDGTRHYFNFDNATNSYKDENGQDLTMTIDAASSTERFKIKDKSDNQLSFNSYGYLTFIKDNNNNKITLGYSGDYIVNVTDGAGRITTLKRDATSNNLTQIIDPSGRITSYTYTGSDLTRITYPDGKYSQYSYDLNHNLIEAKNFDGYRINYSYYPNAPFRILKATETHINSSQVITNGQSLQFSYGSNTTSFVDNIGRKEIYQFNDRGHTVSMKDVNGNAQHYKYNTSGSNVNKLSAASKLQRTTVNYLLNHNVETTGSWTAGKDGGAGTTGYSTDMSYMGNQSTKLTKTDRVSRQYSTQINTLTKGKTYTFSAYVNTVNVSNTNGKGALISFYYHDKAGAWQQIDSEYVNGTTTDWQRLQVSFTLPSDALDGTVLTRLTLLEETGTAYFDSMQLEEGSIANRYNLVENADFSYGSTFPTYWNQESGSASSNIYTTVGGGPSYMDSKVFGIAGNANELRNINQTIKVKGKKGDIFTFGGWTKGDSIPITDLNRYYALVLGFKKSDGTYQYIRAGFNQDSSDWQYVSDTATADSDYSEVTIFATYYHNQNTAYFDGLQLYFEPFENQYSYDSKGNLITSKDIKQIQSSFTYSSANDLTQYTDPLGNVYKYTYDTKHNVLTSVSPKNIVSSFSYDSYGNTTGTSIKSSDGLLTIDGSTTYTSDGNYISTIKDASGNVVSNNYDLKKGTLIDSTDPYSRKTMYTYDPNTDQLLNVSKTVDQQTSTNSYQYQNDLLSGITQNGTSIGLQYNLFGDTTKVNIGSKSLVTKTYDNSTHLLQSSQYSLGDTIYYGYDNADRITYKSLNQSPKTNSSVIPNFSYEYDNNGNLGIHTDRDNNVSYRYDYDILNRITKIQDSLGNSFEYTYNANNQVTKDEFSTPSNTYTTSYSYDSEGNQTSVSFNQSKIDYGYDTLGRLQQKTINLTSGDYTSSYTFKPGVASGKTTNLVDTYKNGVNSPISYTYDKMGNIETITHDGKTITYAYNELSELLREDNPVSGQTIVFTYDVGGNIKTKNIYAFTSPSQTPANPVKTYTYQYGDTNWRDLLTSIDVTTYTNGTPSTVNTQIAYGQNGIDNPTSYGSNTLTWTWGDQLKSFSNANYGLSYSYNDGGFRTKKVVTNKQTNSTVTTNYILEGDKVVYEMDGTNNIHYTYDAAGILLSLNVNGTEYYYLFNTQGDIIGLINGSGSQVVSYQYDAWGNSTSISGTLKDTIGKLNPYRYRGYRYDSETGLYYLNARYYNPEWGRFLNADSFGGQLVALLSHNVFAYGLNNPVMMVDPTGNIPVDFEERRYSRLSRIKMVEYIPEVVRMEVPWGVGSVRTGVKVVSTVSKVVNSSTKGINNTKPYTKSSLKLGQQMHKSYKVDDVLEGVREKEFRLPSGKRIDFIDFEKKIIYELKPYNPRAMRQGNRQLERYKKEVEEIYGGDWKTKLDVY
ncbi:DNRLRE domain-containing protein [Neobacillus sp. DY30]|uniref:DNRLRE domain-containing protein n=1 Tax=Neobacillus sp. DY30 TaxID=3047871 RepID=UPI0024BFDB86|nr:DNRLRE domain-containing protein [Neobacillus sp. DY30]WHY01333.1 DNRLRE domain-containing protein [Neobacillus sp. DY30]